jgi:hypothetical protein
MKKIQEICKQVFETNDLVFLSPEEQSNIARHITLPVTELVKEMCSIPKIHDALICRFGIKLQEGLSSMRFRKEKSTKRKGKEEVSCFMKKDFTSLKNLDWKEVMNEMMEKMPVLAKLCLLTSAQKRDVDDIDKLQLLLPKLGMVFAILVQHNNNELSRIQRVITAVLQDSICDQKVKFYYYMFLN